MRVWAWSANLEAGAVCAYTEDQARELITILAGPTAGKIATLTELDMTCPHAVW